MACSLEKRIPLLNRRIVEFALKLLYDMNNIQGEEDKQVLRDLLYRYFPSSLVDRPKQGFAVPLGRWLRNELRDWVEELLSERKMQEQEFFDVHTIRELWKSHLDGYDDHSSRLWGVLMFQSWLETYSDN